MMHRFQLTIHPESLAELRSRSSRLGISIAEYVRGLIERDVSPPRTGNRVESITALGSSDGGDVASDKDEWLRDIHR